MKNLTNYIHESIHSSSCIQMIQSILDECSKHNDCKYDKEKNAWTGKDAELWKGAGQFLYDYVQALDQNDLQKIVKHFGWEKWIPDVNDVHPQEISMCVSLTLTN